MTKCWAGWSHVLSKKHLNAFAAGQTHGRSCGYKHIPTTSTLTQRGWKLLLWPGFWDAFCSRGVGHTQLGAVYKGYTFAVKLSEFFTPCQAKSFASAQGNKMKTNLSLLPPNSHFRFSSINSCQTGLGWMPCKRSIVRPLRKLLAAINFGASLSKSRQHSVHLWGSVKSGSCIWQHAFRCHTGLLQWCGQSTKKWEKPFDTSASYNPPGLQGFIGFFKPRA